MMYRVHASKYISSFSSDFHSYYLQFSVPEVYTVIMVREARLCFLLP